ncbi:MAG TPA: 2Fe-2S iron-sulfur cluster-binding protein, partial [bacterium]|nr:2Fe-2S iron-sulfur cluster-binding protein [bacterium]
MEIILTVNAEKKELKIKPSEMLLDVLRRNGYQGVKEGCRQGECGSCTVLVDGLPVTSCIYPAAKADGKKVTTVEALAVDGQLSVLQESFLDEGAVQCGYCTPGMLMSSRALLDRN